jgi:hypothetical protein
MTVAKLASGKHRVYLRINNSDKYFGTFDDKTDADDVEIFVCELIDKGLTIDQIRTEIKQLTDMKSQPKVAIESLKQLTILEGLIIQFGQPRHNEALLKLKTTISKLEKENKEMRES